MNDRGAAITEISSGVFGLRFEMPAGVQAINVYVLSGDPVTLVDTGPILPGIPEALHRALEAVGCPAGTIGQIVVTHHHPDHMGLAARLVEESGARVVCHRHGRRILSDYRAEQARLRDYLIGLSAFAGLERERASGFFFKPGTWDSACEPVSVDETVDDGDTIRTGPGDLRALHTPGHTIDHVCLYDPERRLMFTGDMLLRTITPNPDLYPPWQSERLSGLPDYIDSLHKIREFDTATALPGHGEPVDGFLSRIDEVLLHHEERLVFLRDDIVGDDKTILQLAVVLLDHVGMDAGGVNLFLAMREVFGHLLILQANGDVTMELRGGTAYYRAAR